MRLDRMLANAGLGTRSEVKSMIRAGRVSVNNALAKEPDMDIAEGADLKVDGRAINTAKYRYFLVNKPAGMITATEDKKQKTVLELLPAERPADLFPVGRLDKDTTGLLLITNDGELGHRLLSPKRHVDKSYIAGIEGIPDEEACRRFRQGLDLGDFVTEAAGLELLETDKRAGTAIARVTIHEGKFHQIKRMFEAVGCSVVTLKRVSFGPWNIEMVPEEGDVLEISVDRDKF